MNALTSARKSELHIDYYFRSTLLLSFGVLGMLYALSLKSELKKPVSPNPAPLFLVLIRTFLVPPFVMYAILCVPELVTHGVTI